jgi:hypothetical protein
MQYIKYKNIKNKIKERHVQYNLDIVDGVVEICIFWAAL